MTEHIMKRSWSPSGLTGLLVLSLFLTGFPAADALALQLPPAVRGRYKVNVTGTERNLVNGRRDSFSLRGQFILKLNSVTATLTRTNPAPAKVTLNLTNNYKVTRKDRAWIVTANGVATLKQGRFTRRYNVVGKLRIQRKNGKFRLTGTFQGKLKNNPNRRINGKIQGVHK